MTLRTVPLVGKGGGVVLRFRRTYTQLRIEVSHLMTQHKLACRAGGLTQARQTFTKSHLCQAGVYVTTCTYLLSSGEQVVGEPVQRQTGGYIKRKISCNQQGYSFCLCLLSVSSIIQQLHLSNGHGGLSCGTHAMCQHCTCSFQVLLMCFVRYAT